MVLTVLNPELWIYGLLGSIYTKEPYFAAFITIFYWTGMTYLARHITDPPDLQVVVHGHNLASLLLGALVGLAFNYYLRQYTLVDTRIIDKHNRRDTPWIFLLAVSALTLGAAFYLLDGSFNKLEQLGTSEHEANILGAALFVVGLIVLFWSFYAMLTVSRLQRLNLKYVFYAALEAATPALVDYFLFIEEYRPWQILNFVAGWIILSALQYVYIMYIYADEDNYWSCITDVCFVRANVASIEEQPCERPEQIADSRWRTKRSQVIKFILLKFFVVITTYTTAIIVDEVYGNECTSTDCAMVTVVEQTLAAVGGWSAFWIVAFVAARWALKPQPITTLSHVDGEFEHVQHESLRQSRVEALFVGMFAWLSNSEDVPQKQPAVSVRVTHFPPSNARPQIVKPLKFI